MIEFLLNNEVVGIEQAPADLTVLEYLRDQRRLCGTKEGCASGDCGACTVVLAEPGMDGLKYQNCNSCITFLGALHGRQLITVEHLKNQQTLHPVQQAMVDYHGAQCGFCTPGFVMSMFALYKNLNRRSSPGERKTATQEYLGGNLCRCTGYKSIIDAAMESSASVQGDQFNQRAADTNQQLAQIAPFAKARAATTGTENFHLPETCEALGDLINRLPGARLLAGGTDLALEVTQQLQSMQQIIYLGHVSALQEIHITRQHYRIGAAVTLSDFHRMIKDDYPDLSRLLLRFGSRQIRNLGTLGGNIANASPIGDLPPVLLVLNARLDLQSADTRRTVDMDDFFVGYRQTALKKNEFIRAISIPRADAEHQCKVYKISKRLDDDISAVCMAFNVQLENRMVKSIRIACGGMAAIPKRAMACEQALLGKPLDPDSIAAAQHALTQDFQPIDDVRASAAYRMRVAQNLLARLQLELAGAQIPTTVANHV